MIYLYTYFIHTSLAVLVKLAPWFANGKVRQVYKINSITFLVKYTVVFVSLKCQRHFLVKSHPHFWVCARIKPHLIVFSWTAIQFGQFLVFIIIIYRHFAMVFVLVFDNWLNNNNKNVLVVDSICQSSVSQLASMLHQRIAQLAFSVSNISFSCRWIIFTSSCQLLVA